MSATSARISGVFIPGEVMGMLRRSLSDWISYCGRLGHDAVVDAVLRVEEEHGAELRASAEDVDDAAADIALGVAALRRLGAVHVDLEGGVVVRLLDAQVGQAGHLAQLAENVVGDLAIAGDVGSFQLHIDRGGQAEVEDLRDDVRRAGSRRWCRGTRAAACRAE